MTQFNFFKKDIKRMLGSNYLRLLHIWLSRVFIGILVYRMERSFFLLLGDSYKIIRIIFLPLINLLQSYSNIDINYKANIKGGVLILHSSVGVVISGKSIIGKNLTLTGGNIIGTKIVLKSEAFIIGNNCELGANATIIGPLILGNNIKVGASACVVTSFIKENSILIGVPAKIL